MSRIAVALAAFAGLAAYLWNRNPSTPDYGVQDLGIDLSGVTEAATGLQPEQLPSVVPARDDRNAAAALAMVRASEGTAGLLLAGPLTRTPSRAIRRFISATPTRPVRPSKPAQPAPTRSPTQPG